MDVRALLWDVDGTLADTEMGGHRLAFNRAFEAAGLPWHWDTTTYGQLLAISGGRERIRHFFARAREGPVSEAEVETLMAAKQAAYADLARGGRLPLRPGVKRLVAETAARGVPQVLVTTSSRSAVAALLEGQGTDLASAFAFWICGEDVAAKKPSPEGYLLALERLSLPSFRVVALEDSPQGLAAAQGAGLACLLTLGERPAPGTSSWWRRAAGAVSHLGEEDNPSEVLTGPPCQEGRITLSWLCELLEEG
ncbi:MAG: HAD-IA family hydrolase [Cyanobacteriota bacterium]